VIIIYPEKLSTVTADTEDSSFPASNLEDNKIKKVWKTTGSNEGTLTITAASGANQIAVFGTNAATATVTIKVGAVTQEAQSFTLSNGGHTYNRFWCSYTAIGSTHTIEVQLAAAVGSVLQAGVVKCGVGVTFAEPDYGVNESRQDLSVVKELNNGALYIRKRDIVRTFSCTIMEDRTTDYYLFSDIYDYYGPQAVAFLLTDDLNDSRYEWAVLGHMKNPFKGNHEYYSHSNISFDILEAV